MQSLRDSLTATRHRATRRERVELRSQRQAARVRAEVREASEIIGVGFAEMHRAAYAFTSRLTSIWVYFVLYAALYGLSVGLDALGAPNLRLHLVWVGVYYLLGPLYRRFCRRRGYDRPMLIEQPIQGQAAPAAPAPSALAPRRSGPSLPQLMRGRRRV